MAEIDESLVMLLGPSSRNISCQLPNSEGLLKVVSALTGCYVPRIVLYNTIMLISA